MRPRLSFLLFLLFPLVSSAQTIGALAQEQQNSLVPEEVSLVVEPLSSAPPLYPGEPAVPVDGNNRIVAIANFKDVKGKPIDPGALTYTWVVDDTTMGNASGVGKMVAVVASPLEYRARTVEVGVQNQDGTLSAKNSISLTPSEPIVRVYENDPLLGIRFDRAISDSFSIAGAEKSFYGVPYSFSLANGEPSLEWFLNGDAAQAGNLITLRPSGSGEGSASLSLTASSGGLNQASTNFSLSFGKQQSNIFGL